MPENDSVEIALLKEIPLFSSLPEGELLQLAPLLKQHRYPAHHTLFWMNERGNCLYIVSEGRVSISYTNEEGEEVSLATLGRGAFFGELSLLDGEPHSATARTATASVLLTLDRETFYNYLNRHPQLGYKLTQVLVKRLRNSTVKMQKIVNINHELEAKRSPLQHTVDGMAKALTNGYFLTIYVVFITGWIVWQVLAYHHQTKAPISFADKPPDFPVLSFLIALTSFVLSLLILNSQRRQADDDRVRGEIEYQINLKSQTEVMKLQLKMDQLLERIHALEEQLSASKK